MCQMHLCRVCKVFMQRLYGFCVRIPVIIIPGFLFHQLDLSSHIEIKDRVRFTSFDINSTAIDLMLKENIGNPYTIYGTTKQKGTYFLHEPK